MKAAAKSSGRHRFHDRAQVVLWLCGHLAYPPIPRYSCGLLVTEIQCCWLPGAPTPPVDPACVRAAEHAAKLCEALGHSVTPTDWNLDGRALMHAFLTVIMHYTHLDVGNIARLLDVPERQLDLELNTRFMAMAGSGIGQDTVAQALATWQQAAQKMAELHQQFDLILTPTVATPALPGDALDPSGLEKLIMKLMLATGLGRKAVNAKSLDMAIDKSLYATPFTPIANITGQPAMSVPLYQEGNNQPHGAQFMAAVGGDAMLLRLARQLEQACPWADNVPGDIPRQGSSRRAASHGNAAAQTPLP